MSQKITNFIRLRLGPQGAVLAAACIFFYAAGRLFIPIFGIQNDEALFGDGIYGPSGATFLEYHRYRIPIMLISYLGTLKAWIFRVLFHYWAPSASSIRTPVLLSGVATLCLLFVTLRRVAGRRAAVIACALLATDATFLLTTCLDWGPVALQHLLLWGAIFLLIRYYGQNRWADLAWAFFLLGLGLWDKALLIWSLAGLGIAALAVFPREVLPLVTWRRLAVAVPAFCLGSLPLIVYNVQHPLETFRSNASFDASDLKGKSALLWSSLEGSAMFYWLSPPDAEVLHPTSPRNSLQKISFWIAAKLGRREASLAPLAMIAALGLFPMVVWRSRGRKFSPVKALLFALIFLIVVWAQMAFTKGAGGGVHHAVLLWPFPQWFMAITFAAVSRWVGWGKTVLLGVLALLCATNALVINQYYVDAARNGGALNWTDAIYPLTSYLRGTPAPTVFVVDWGILDGLRLLDRGRLPLRVGSDASSREQVKEWLSDRDRLFVAHTDGQEFFKGSKANLRRFGAELGYRPEVIRVIYDRHGRGVFEVYRFVR